LPRCFVQQKTAKQVVAAGLQACSWLDLGCCAEKHVPVRDCDFEAAVLQPVQMQQALLLLLLLKVTGI